MIQKCVFICLISQGGEVGHIQDVVKFGFAQQFTREEEEVHQSYTFIDDRADSHELPVFEHKEKILELIHGHQVVCIEGGNRMWKINKDPSVHSGRCLGKESPS